MDGCIASSYGIAASKAYTAVKFGEDTVRMRYQRALDGDPCWELYQGAVGWSDLDITITLATDSRFCAWAGGIQLIHRHDDGTSCVIGALGVSGLSELQDDAVARKAIEDTEHLW